MQSTAHGDGNGYEKGVRGSRELNRELGVEHANTRGVQ